jgi:hypothetical protein
MIDFAIRLESHGWALATVRDGPSQTTVLGSYLSDALRDFVDAVQSVSTTSTAECAWQQEPGIARWRFCRERDRVRLDISESQATFSAEDDFLRFCEEVDSAFRKLLNEFGRDWYRDKWGHPYPEEAHKKLQHAVAYEREHK